MTKRNTWQREAVRKALTAREGFVSAQGLHSDLREADSPIGLATVYRALADLANVGEADMIQSSDGENVYRACTSGQHHHHVICRRCGLTVEIEAAVVESWAQAAAAEHGFTDTRHVVDVFGLCPTCSTVT